MKAVYVTALLALTALSTTIVCGQGGGRFRKMIEARRAEQQQSPAGTREIDVNGVKRSYILHLPSGYKKGSSLPLVIAFHGGGGNAQNMVRMSGFSEKADKENFVVAYPNGAGRMGNALLTFNAVGCCAFTMRNNVDDAAFISKLIDSLVAEYGVDRSRVYLTGFSNGAMISSYLAAKLSDKIAAAAPVSGSIFASSPRPAGKVAILLIHGTSDTAVPYDGGMSQRAQIEPAQSEPYKSVKDGAAYWSKNSGCRSVPEKSVKGNITTEKYVGCAPQSDVEVILIKGGLHAWPGGNKGRDEADEPSKDLNATDVIWDFFKQHHK
ncbi:MAG TPA: PHB depolymerase family esterase [Pyrinomonadaceae bacterium]|nr:PHB depolymerase family esterase [Pyrinomonadaceae bacterium]